MSKSNSLIWRLLRKNVSTGQLAGFSVASLVGLVIVAVAVQFYHDVAPIFSADDSFIGRDYIIISNHISGMGSFMGAKPVFSDDEIDDIQSQPWAMRLGRFTTSQYSITASVGMGGHSMSTKMFFEAIPDEFLDIDPAQWDFDPKHPEIPVIVARDYLSIYNFGFAAAQGMPQVSENMVSMVPITFILSGAGHRDTIPGRIVGFSNRLNTIVVPQEFLSWSNNRYSLLRHQQPSRLIIEINSMSDPGIDDYMSQHGYDIAGDKANSRKTTYLVTIMTTIVAVIGLVISALAFLVLMLSIYLLLQKNSRRLRNLLILGYPPAQITAPYIRLVVAINVAVLIIAIAATIIVRSLYMPLLTQIGDAGGSVVGSIVVATAIMALITAVNIVAIRRRIRSLW